MVELPKIVKMLHHPDPASGTSVFDDGVKAHWTERPGGIVAWEAPWSSPWWEPLGRPKSVYAKILLDDDPAWDGFEQLMTDEEKSQWELARLKRGLLLPR